MSPETLLLISLVCTIAATAWAAMVIASARRMRTLARAEWRTANREWRLANEEREALRQEREADTAGAA